MIRSVAPVHRLPGTTFAEFVAHWGEVHGPLARRISQLSGYVQSRCHPEDQLTDHGFDGCATAWVADRGVIAQMRTAPEYLDGARRDEPTFVDTARMHAVLMRVTEATGLPRAEVAHAVKAMCLLRSGGPAIAAPGALRREHSVVGGVSELGGAEGSAGFDTLVELWFPDLSALRSALPDDAIVGRGVVLVARDHVVIPPPVEPSTSA